MNISHWASNVPIKQALETALKDSAIQEALLLMAEYNTPINVLRLQIPDGMTSMEAIALDSARRAGFHEAIVMLKSLPFWRSDTQERMKAVQTIGDSWEHYTPQDLKAGRSINKPSL